ncbi:hypothetical protein [Geodermatophilus sp. CPCC 206100]|uniref:hypothetical protein n=1 Tax=Geodermatophilus sp. CPCC 206100 TaxID=3020054 RepID=UPI003B0017D3
MTRGLEREVPDMSTAGRKRLDGRLQLTRFAAGSSPSDTLVVSHYPVGGNDANTGPRYQAEASLTGYDILGITRVGTNTLRPSPGLRAELSPDRFAATCEDHAPELLSACRGYDYVIMRGQSTGTLPTLGILMSEAIPATHLLIEDGINTRRSRDGSVRRPIPARLDWWRHTRSERVDMSRPPVAEWSLPTRLPTTWGTVLEFLVEQYHWAPIWRSGYTRDSVIEIVRRQPRLPVLIKLFGHTAMTTRSEAQSFRADIEDIAQKRRSRSPDVAEVRIDFDVDAWHGFIVYPEYGAANLREARAMPSPLASTGERWPGPSPIHSSSSGPADHGGASRLLRGHVPCSGREA